jgi:dTDP-4-amino-4,6-dideoxygalactose transaminase
MTPAQTRSIPFFDYPHLFSSDEQALLEIFRGAGRRGAFILQQDLARFEQRLAAFLGAKYAVGVANATDGLLIALRACGITSGEVIFSSHTMVATAAAIHFAGATPVPVDCGCDHLIDPRAAERAITAGTRAILPTQLNGRTADMDELGQIAERHGLTVIEDAAQALGSRFRGRAAATFGRAAAISFFPAKLLGCLGDGGAVITNDEEVYGRVLELRDHGRRADGEVVSWGLNSRLDNLQAAILDHRLDAFPAAIERRRALALLYQERLGDVEELRLPPAPGASPEHFDVYQNYEVEAERRDALREYLKARGIGTLVPWSGKAVHQWAGLGFQARLPFTERLFERLLLLPMNLSLTDAQAEEICDAIQAFYRG